MRTLGPEYLLYRSWDTWRSCFGILGFLICFAECFVFVVGPLQFGSCCCCLGCWLLLVIFPGVWCLSISFPVSCDSGPTKGVVPVWGFVLDV